MSTGVRLARIMRPTSSAVLNTLLLLAVVSIRSPAAARSVAARAPVAAALLPHDYQDDVCKPLTRQLNDTVPPCVEIETIETTCTPNGTGPLFLAAHQQCMCRGSYFADWPACLSCLFLHGLRTERDVGHFAGVLRAASSAFCGAASPTAEFAGVFAGVQATATPPATGATVGSDGAAGETAVSLYYTATGRQGPGLITGDAAQATATALLTATRVVTPARDSDSDAQFGTKAPSAQGGLPTGNGTTHVTMTPSQSSGPISSTKPDGAVLGRAVDWRFLAGAVGAGVVLFL